MELSLFTGADKQITILPENLQASPELNGGFRKEYAIDNNVNTFYHSQKQQTSFFEVTLKSKKLITRVVIVNRLNCCEHRINGAVIQLLKDGHLVKDCGTIKYYREDSATEEGQTYEVWCRKYGDQVRITLDGEYLHIAEIRIFRVFIGKFILC